MNFGVFDLSALLPFIAVGFAAQLVDGALGMAFGVISNTLLVGFLGVPPALRRRYDEHTNRSARSVRRLARA